MNLMKFDEEEQSEPHNVIDLSNSYTRREFLNTLGKSFYQNVDSSDIVGMYQATYKAYESLSKLVKMEPTPKSYSEVEDFNEFNLFTELCLLEFMVSVHYYGGLGAISAGLGRDVKSDLLKIKDM